MRESKFSNLFTSKKNYFVTKKRHYSLRYAVIGVFFALAILVFLIRLITLQFNSNSSNTQSKIDPQYISRTETIQALRGYIYDRNGKLLVSNEYTYNIQLDGQYKLSNEELNKLILSVFNDAISANEADTCVISNYPFIETNDSITYNEEYLKTSQGNKFKDLLSKLKIDLSQEALKAKNKLISRYEIKTDEFTNEQVKTLLATRLDMEFKNFSKSTPYTILKGISRTLMSKVFENNEKGIALYTATSRKYEYPGYASHILGTVGKIQPDYVEYYSNLGYSLDATVGIFGAEATFENYLHGEDGEMTILEDQEHNIVARYITKEPKPGGNVYLTIDIDLQMVAENSLKDNIDTIHTIAANSGKTLNGEDANAGAITAIDIKTGEVLALASYPTFDLTQYNKQYNELSSDVLAPLFNRSLEGLYAPGSTFKPGIAAAALMENIVDTTTLINDTGKYTVYDDYTPKCWIFDSAGHGHGYINISTAIEVSCNYFFYSICDDGNGKTGLGINKMNQYCSHYGLGLPTGIELNEKTGVLAGPDYRLSSALQSWTPGDTLQAAIGQSDNLFSPLQISVYMSTLLNGGSRTKATILKEVKSFNSSTNIYETHPIIVDSISIPEDTLTTIKNAMKKVSENGMAATMFNTFEVEIGAKTGTAEVSSNSSSNAVFTAFAPFDDPEIVVTSIIEHGASGIYAGYSVKNIFAKYFNIVD